jgi:hypothetical protein
MDACRTPIKHLFHFWGGTPVLDVCIRKPSLVSPLANVTARTKSHIQMVCLYNPLLV